MGLVTLRRGERALVVGLAEHLDPSLQHRLRALGLRPGAEVEALGRAPLGSPWRFRVGTTQLCLRRSEATAVLVEAAASGVGG